MLPTLYMPQGAAPGQNAFSFSDAPVAQHLTGLGYPDASAAFHTLLVLSPLPRFVNPGFTAWAPAGGAPHLYVMRCLPQNYYLVHELGHR